MIVHFFFLNDTATTEIYTLSLHDALPICFAGGSINSPLPHHRVRTVLHDTITANNIDGLLVISGCVGAYLTRSEEHTSELQSQFHLVCRLLLEKKKTIHNKHSST